MTNREKERFCAFAALLVAPPDGAIVDELRQEDLRSLIEGHVRRWEGDTRSASFFIREESGGALLTALQEEYARLFGQWEGEKISLVESTYKAWTGDKTCGMVFSASRGLLMGDCALHMNELYRRLSLEVPEAFRGTPDHLALELEFLALLYRSASDAQIEQFIGDHLDWLPDLKEALEKTVPHPFYSSAVELIHLFLLNETNNGKVKHHG